MGTTRVPVRKVKKMLTQVPLVSMSQKKDLSFLLHIRQLVKKYLSSDPSKRLDILAGMVVLLFAILMDDKSLISLAHDVARKGKPKIVKKA